MDHTQSTALPFASHATLRPACLYLHHFPFAKRKTNKGLTLPAVYDKMGLTMELHMGRLERKLDLDLIARIEAGWTPKDDKIRETQRKLLKKPKPPRPAWTYRGAWRNIQADR